MKYIDNLLNKITMYRVVLYGLTALVCIAVALSFFGAIPYSPLSILESLILLSLVCYFSNIFFAKVFGAQINVESAWITAFILCLILSPVSSFSDLTIYVLVALVAMGSKYILAIGKKHIFNPVAVSIFVIGIFGSGLAMWWVGNSIMLFAIVILGFLILRKTRRFEMFFAFAIVASLSTAVSSFFHSFAMMESVSMALMSGPLIFFGTVMLTEPQTTPPNRKFQILYGIIVGLLYGLDYKFGFIYKTPELALLIGNIFAYAVSPKDRLKLELVEKNKLSSDIYEFVWKSDKKLVFEPGQYLEWTLGQFKPDTRGNRRYFTIASSPTEEYIKLGIKTYPNSSSFKSQLVSLGLGSSIFASQLAGEFTMPTAVNQKVVWIAGGIGVTPFRSMAKYIVDKEERRDIVLFFSNRTPQDIVYKDIFEQAEKFGLKTINVVNSLSPEESNLGYKVGLIDEVMIKTEVPDYKERVFYISGPHGMVSAFETTLKRIGVPSNNIKTDFFPGFV